MDNIKFKAWDIKNSKMIPWEKLVKCYNLNALFDKDSIVSKSYILMQYTGFIDKNGTEIYVGDNIMNNLGSISTVEMYNGGYIPLTSFPKKSYWNSEECEVIGNIQISIDKWCPKNEALERLGIKE